MKKELVTLNNGLKTIFVDSPGSTAATVQVWFRAGSALEKKHNYGIAHFLEHMFFKGTPTRPGAQIAHDVESFGGEINAFTSFDYTCYYINSPNTHLNTTVNILMDMVSNPMFKEEDLLPERDVVFEEFRRSIDNPNQFAFNKIQSSCFSSGYNHAILGTENTIKNFSQKQLKEFRNNFYNIQNTFLLISGDLKEKSKIIQSIESFELPSGEVSNFPKFKLKEKPVVEVHSKEVRQSMLTLSINSSDFQSPQAPAEDLAISCLGHGETSPMYKELILNSSLSSNASASSMFMKEGGTHLIRITFPQENLDKVLNSFKKMLKDQIANGFNSKEIQKLKNQYIASKIFDLESVESFAFSIGHSYAQTNNLESDEEFINKVKNTTAAAVNNALVEIFKRPIHCSLQVPSDYNKTKAKEKLAKFQKDINKNATPQNKSAKNKLKVQTTKHDPQVQLIKIKKGIQLLYRKNDMNPTFILHAYVRGGLTEENNKNNGINHLLASLLTKGHKDAGFEKLKGDLELMSAYLSNFSGKNAYGITLHGLSEHFSSLLKHFNGSLLNPKFDNKLFQNEKKQTLRMIDNKKEDPVKVCFQSVSEHFFDGHPYSMPSIGTESSIKSIKRADLVKLHEKNIKNKEILITYCGDLELFEVQEQLKDLFNSLPSRSEKKIKPKKMKQITKTTFIPMDREQTQIFTGVSSGKLGSKDLTYLKMLTTHLSGQSSELFVEVRDRQGLCYTAQPVQFTAIEGGYWGIYMASGHDKVEAALDAINKIIQNIRYNGISKKEFERIKVMIEGQSLINVQTNEDYANIYSIPILQGYGLDFYHNKNVSIRELKYEDFLSGIKRILGKKWSTVIVGREN